MTRFVFSVESIQIVIICLEQHQLAVVFILKITRQPGVGLKLLPSCLLSFSSFKSSSFVFQIVLDGLTFVIHGRQKGILLLNMALLLSQIVVVWRVDGLLSGEEALCDNAVDETVTIPLFGSQFLEKLSGGDWACGGR